MSLKTEEELDVKEIVRTIKEKAQSRQLKADLQMLNEIDIRKLDVEGYGTEKPACRHRCESLEENLYYLNTHYTLSDKIQPVLSRRGGILGRLAKFMMNRVVFVIGESLKKLIETQQEFNVRSVRVLNSIEKLPRPSETNVEEIRGNIGSLQDKVASLSRDIETSNSDVTDVKKIVEENADVVSGMKKNITALQGNLDEVQENLGKETAEKITHIKTIITEDRKKELTELKQSIQYPDLNIDYTAFEDKFRGDQAIIKEKFKKYLRFFHECKNVMDIGCGRGEFIELLHSNGTGAFGLEIDEKMVETCRNKNLNVPHIDAISYLKEQFKRKEPDKVDGIFSAQVVEHLHKDYLMEMLRLCYKILQPNKFIVLETVNIKSLSTFTNSAYLDPTHVNLLHPETLKFLLESVGFRDIEFIFSGEFGEDEKLQPLPEISDQARIFNKNVEKLNELLFAPQDYAVIAQK